MPLPISLEVDPNSTSGRPCLCTAVLCDPRQTASLLQVSEVVSTGSGGSWTGFVECLLHTKLHDMADFPCMGDNYDQSQRRMEGHRLLAWDPFQVLPI